jgi:hypothetical protein
VTLVKKGASVTLNIAFRFSKRWVPYGEGGSASQPTCYIRFIPVTASVLEPNFPMCSKH